MATAVKRRNATKYWFTNRIYRVNVRAFIVKLHQKLIIAVVYVLISFKIEFVLLLLPVLVVSSLCAPRNLFVPFYSNHRFNFSQFQCNLLYVFDVACERAKWMPNDVTVLWKCNCTQTNKNQTWKTPFVNEKHAIGWCTMCINYEAQTGMIDCMWDDDGADDCKNTAQKRLELQVRKTLHEV